MNEPMIQEGFTGRCQKVLQVAKDLYQRRPDWVTFFRETLGVNGAARSVFPSIDDYVRFKQTPEHDEVRAMVSNLRTAKIRGGGKDEATRVITVRLPECLHEALKQEATDHHTSMNKLCISKLLQVLIENEAAEAASRAAAQAKNPAAIPAPAQAPQASQTPIFRQQTNPIPASQPMRTSSQAAPTNFRSTWQQGE